MGRLVCNLTKLDVANCVLCEMNTASCKAFDYRDGVLGAIDGIARWVSGLQSFMQADDLRNDLSKFVHGESRDLVLVSVCYTKMEFRKCESSSLESVEKMKEVGGTSDLKYERVVK